MRNAGKSTYEDTCMRNRILTNPKWTVRVGFWNVLSMYSTGKTAQICRETNCIEQKHSEIHLTLWAAATSLSKNRDKINGNVNDIHAKGCDVYFKKGWQTF